jgi:FlaA1/EpsC-like NDP-sugar epimerase
MQSNKKWKDSTSTTTVIKFTAQQDETMTHIFVKATISLLIILYARYSYDITSQITRSSHVCVAAFMTANNALKHSISEVKVLHPISSTKKYLLRDLSYRYLKCPVPLDDDDEIDDEIDVDPRYSDHHQVSKSAMQIIYRRRDLLVQLQQQFSTLMLTTLLLGEYPAHAELNTALLDETSDTGKRKTILITGANSGIGFESCRRLNRQGHTIILACRSLSKAQDAIDRIQRDESAANVGRLIPAECDLADMSSIQNFVQGLSTNIKIDTLCLNAGVARNTGATTCTRTANGFELTGKLTCKSSFLSQSNLHLMNGGFAFIGNH